MITKYELTVIVNYMKGNPEWIHIEKYFNLELSKMTKYSTLDKIQFILRDTDVEFVNFLNYFKNISEYLHDKLVDIYVVNPSITNTTNNTPIQGLVSDLWKLLALGPTVTPRDVNYAQLSYHKDYMVVNSNEHHNHITPVKDLYSGYGQPKIIGFLYSTNGFWRYYEIDYNSTSLVDKIITDFYVNPTTQQLTGYACFDNKLALRGQLNFKPIIEKITVIMK